MKNLKLFCKIMTHFEVHNVDDILKCNICNCVAVRKGYYDSAKTVRNYKAFVSNLMPVYWHYDDGADIGYLSHFPTSVYGRSVLELYDSSDPEYFTTPLVVELKEEEE